MDTVKVKWAKLQYSCLSPSAYKMFMWRKQHRWEGRRPQRQFPASTDLEDANRWKGSDQLASNWKRHNTGVLSVAYICFGCFRFFQRPLPVWAERGGSTSLLEGEETVGTSTGLRQDHSTNGRSGRAGMFKLSAFKRRFRSDVRSTTSLVTRIGWSTK